MADNLCGPSNGVKDLVTQVDRDRDIHQSRLVNTGVGRAGSSFRSQAALGNANNGAVETFQHGAGAMPADPMTAGPPASGSIFGGPTASGSIFGGPMAPIPAAPGSIFGGPLPGRPFLGAGNNVSNTALTDVHPAAQTFSVPNNVGPFSMPMLGQAGTGPHHLASDSWIDEFANMRTGGEQNMMRPSGVAPPVAAPAYYPTRTRFARGMAIGAGMSMPTHTAGSEAAVAADQAAFERAFAYYDDGRFDEERERWEAENNSSQRLSSPIPDSPASVRSPVAVPQATSAVVDDNAENAIIADDTAALDNASDDAATLVNDGAATAAPTAVPTVNPTQLELEFLQAQDAWMDQNYTQADREEARRNAVISAEEWADIEAEMTAIADEEDMYRLEGNPLYLPADARGGALAAAGANPTTTTTTTSNALSRAAGDIVSALSDNESDKFKNSSFVEMMRRIRAGEVTVQGNDLVDTATGRAVGVPAEDEADQPEASGSAPRK